MAKIVINSCYGGFSLSREASELYAQKTGAELGEWNSTWKYYEKFRCREIARDDPLLVEIVEQMGKKASGYCADLKIVQIPDGIEWTIHEYDGNEWVAEAHRTWS